MIAGENEDRVVPDPQFIDRCKNSSHIAINRPNVAKILPHRFVEISANFLTFVELVLHRFCKVFSVDLDLLEFSGK